MVQEKAGLNSQRLKCIMAQRSSKCPRRPPKSVRGINYIERMPPEITEMIFSYLDEGSLFCLSFVNKHFYELAENSVMWYRFYTWYRAKSKTSRLIKEVTDGMDMGSIQEMPNGYWRRLFFKELIGHDGSWKWKKKLRSINFYTGLPSRTAKVIRDLELMWEITVRDARGRENRIKHSHVYFNRASLTVVWNSGNWPILDKPTTLEIHGVRLLPIYCPSTWRPGCRSLLKTVVVKKEGGKVLASDKLISLLYIEKGVTIGVWQDQEIAFVLVNLHYHKLVERHFRGSSTISYEPIERQASYNDIDPEYGLHGYTLHLELHNGEESIASLKFAQLYCRKDKIYGEFIPLHVISAENSSGHTPLCEKIRLPWQTESLQGHIEQCCMFTLTVLTEAQTPFWCVTAPVAITKSNRQDVSFDYDAESFFMEYQDSDGKLEIQLEWIENQKQFVMVNMLVFLSLRKVNSHFRCNYIPRDI
ncbi:F-box only protein 15 isoform X2 [Silurus meridionalis]|uniref:F-box only protein 15 isoform X2 n=1 Tax=Silurus meridionalis TaxID=175797 RepID=UPI001EEB8929|nr:F-box only protein 15 isoform X2 [Silurus meridionalis]